MTSPRNRTPQKVSNRTGRSLRAAPKPSGDAFIDGWNALDVRDRRRIKRLVQLGIPQLSAFDAQQAIGYATWARSRPSQRSFWRWFPMLVGAFLVASFALHVLHPVMMGAFLAFLGLKAMNRRNLSRVAKVNAGVLAGTET